MQLALALALGASRLAVAPPADAQSGVTQTTPDGRSTLVSKDVDGFRWAITSNPNDGTVTGNVFPTDGSAPKFVWCLRQSDDGVRDPSQVQIRFACYGADRCAAAPCPAEEWQLIANVTLPGAFLLPASDPFAPLQPPGSFCDPLAHFPEDIGGLPSLGINTTGCNYLTVGQPALFGVRPGDQFFIRTWHFALDAPAPGSAYLAVHVGDDRLWSTEFPIPSPAGVGTFLVTADFEAPAGTPVYFHLQNHGQNSYNLIDVRRDGESGAALVDPGAWTVVSIGLPTRPGG
ncbi:MAG TPA: hypothetical protein VFD92_06795 [Candidatus Binatia bacterium]|nr:hypothetical protein [Candidatus Binatia bacterium]